MEKMGPSKNLEKSISGGNLITEKSRGTVYPNMTASHLSTRVSTSIFAYAIPVIWVVSYAYPFIMETGYDCSTINPLGCYLDDKTQMATGAYVQNKLYCLASVQGDARKFGCEHCDDGGCQNVCRP